MSVTFDYLLCTIILPNISKRSLEWIMMLKVAEILANLVPNYPFALKHNFLLESWLNQFYLPVEPHHHLTAFQTNP